MDAAGREQAELSIARGGLTEAALELAANPERRRLRAGVYALLGDDRGLASVIAPELLAAQNSPEVVAHFESLLEAPASYDYLVAAVRLTWASDATGACDLFNEAHDRAIAEKRFYFAVGARERLAHHAVLFGDVEIARDALEDALRLALVHRLLQWFVRASAAAARLALDTGDSEHAAAVLTRAKSHARDAGAMAMLAPAGASLAAEAGDVAALEEWTSAEILATALNSDHFESAIAATLALLSTQSASLDAVVRTALRRALQSAAGTSAGVELFTLAARFGEIEEARLGAESLAALIAPNRKYIKAHALLARAHLLFRGGERTAWVDLAGDAARAFNAMGMRRWMNEAMLLLVRQEGDNFPRRRGRSVGSALTGREQQIAQLIRRGARNREVAAALQISEHTVERHVSSILGRLGLRSRWQIADPNNTSED
jgi:DNA-binding CsgD family transcriptional regulator